MDTKQKMFYSAITAEKEVEFRLLGVWRKAERLAEGFQDVRVRICNIINFFDIQTKWPGKALDVEIMQDI